MINQNPFCVLGISPTATEREIQKQVTKTTRFAEVGKKISFDTDFTFLGELKRDKELISIAFSAIEQPINRLLHSLFWFWNANHIDAAAFENLSKDNTDKAIEIWEKVVKDGCHLRYFDNNKKQVKFEINIINGQKHGPVKSYYENGQIKRDDNFIDGKGHGSFKSYYENGQIEKDYNCTNGKKHGPFKSHHENGNLKNQLHYKNGNENGQFHSFYDNKAKYREGNFDKNGLVKEYFKNGNLKFLKDKNKYTFYDEDNNLKCETHIDDSNSFFGKWKNYREDGTIEYELDFDDSNSDKVTNKVVKTIFTKGGEIFSENIVSYSTIKMAEVNFINYYANIRMDQSIYSWNTGCIGPPGITRDSINLKPIKSIEEIIKLTPIKDFKNE